MTPYGSDELAGDWEFKILRSGSGGFRKPAVMRQALEEEARAGWTLVEKFDNSRLRLKRPVALRNADPDLDFDPYRTYFGASDAKLAAIVIAAVFGGLLVVALVVSILAILFG